MTQKDKESKKGLNMRVRDFQPHRFPKGTSLSGLVVDNVGLTETADHIEIHERMETGVGDIYAIGDAASLEEMHYSHLSLTVAL
jgi:hypothetical protein